MHEMSSAEFSRNLKAKIFPWLLMAFLVTPFALYATRQFVLTHAMIEIERTGSDAYWKDLANREQEIVLAYVSLILVLVFAIWFVAHLRHYLLHRRTTSEREQDFLTHLNIDKKRK